MKRRILLIIEDTVMALLIQEFLQEYDYEIVVVNDRESGLTIATKMIPDLIICCLRYSKSRPAQIFNALAKKDATARIGFISMGNMENSDRLSEVLYPGRYRSLSVPFFIDDLLRAIDSLT